MAEDHRIRVQENAARIIGWLLEHRAEFEKDGVEESTLTGSVGLSEDEVRDAIDHLESHEDVARVPEAAGNQPRFLLKPARGWQEIAQSAGEEKHASRTV